VSGSVAPVVCYYHLPFLANALLRPSANASKRDSVEVPNREGLPVLTKENTFWKVRPSILSMLDIGIIIEIGIGIIIIVIGIFIKVGNIS
jgi:uncharacterized membrane protein